MSEPFQRNPERSQWDHREPTLDEDRQIVAQSAALSMPYSVGQQPLKLNVI